MITDANLILSGSYSNGVWTGQSVTASPTTSSNVLDLASMSPNQAIDLGMGEDLNVLIDVLTAPTVCTNVTFQIVTADDAGISTNVEVISATDAFPIASLPVGAQTILHIDRSAPYVARRYLAVRYVITGTATSAGSYIAQIVKDVQDIKNTIYKSGFTVQ